MNARIVISVKDTSVSVRCSEYLAFNLQYFEEGTIMVFFACLRICCMIRKPTHKLEFRKWYRQLRIQTYWRARSRQETAEDGAGEEE